MTEPSYRGAEFVDTDFSGAVFRSCEMRDLRMADCWLADVDISGFVEHLVVNDVDVTAYVEAELERRHPERAQLRTMQSADDHRAMWDTIERLWADVVRRARQLPEAARQHRVNGEWSLVETLRHLVFATDAWAVRTVLDEPMPFARLGFTHTGYPPADAAAIGIDLDARPTFEEVMVVRSERMATVRRIVDALTDVDLDRLCLRPPAPGYPEEARPVRKCLRVVMNEECEHHRYATRDLAVLEAAD